MMTKKTGLPGSDTEDQDISFGNPAGTSAGATFTSSFQLGSVSGSFATIQVGPAAAALSSAESASTNMALAISAVITGALSKLDSQLAALHLGQSSMAADAIAFTSMVQQFAGSISGNGQYVVIDATAADGNGSSLLGELQQIGLIGGSSFGAMASGWLPIDQIETLAGLSDLAFARESVMASNVGSVTTQADHALVTDTARSTYGVDGSGIKVGIISDSFNFLGGYNADIASGDLPAGVQILQDSGSTDEGRGMAQLVHDIAPGASLAFATAQGGQANFANNIIALKNAGAKVIVDDVSYFAEPMFQDGVIAQAVDQVAAAGAVYFSAAANNGHKGYEAGYLSSGTTQTINSKAETWHNYDSSTPTIYMPFTLATGRTVTVVLEWNQPAASVSPGHGATSDLDLFVYNASGSVVSMSQTNNIGRDPIEVVQFSNFSGATQTYRIAVGLASGAAPSDFKIVTFNGNGTVSNGFASNTNDGTVYGHAAATNAIAVGAASYAQTPGFGVNPALIESFSSGGPTRIFFDTAGNPISVVRQTPQITAPDGGNTSFFGSDDTDADRSPNFYGTSAAAPAAAAVAALLLQANGSLTPAAIKTVLMNSAIDMDNPATSGFDTGFDSGTGAGLIQANAALAMVASSVAINDVTISEGNSGAKVATFTVTRGGGATAAFDVNFTTSDGSATVADHDYVANSGTLHFATGVNTQTVAVTINGDTKAESDETFFVVLGSPTNGATVSDGTGLGAIVDDDTAGSVTVDNVTISEGNSGSKVATFTVTRSSGVAAFDVNFGTVDGDATVANGDYVQDSGTLHFAAGVNTQTISVAINGDTRVESDETFHVVLGGATNGAVIGHDTGIGTIANDDTPVKDFNGDGKSDFLWRSDAGTLVTWDIDDGQTLSNNDFGVITNNWNIAGTGDFNGDHKTDLLWRSDAGTVATWDINDAQVLSTHDFGVAPGNWTIAGTGDFNGDGKSDLLWRSDAGTIVSWDMNDGQTLGTNTLGVAPADWKIAGTGDVNGDGKSDLLWRSDAGTVATWNINDGQVLSTHDFGVVPNNWKIAGTGDFNGDGKTDLLWRSDAGTVVTWDINDGQTLATRDFGVVPNDWKIAGTGDFNGDSKSDFLWRSDAGTVVTWDINDGQTLSNHDFGVVANNWHLI